MRYERTNTDENQHKRSRELAVSAEGLSQLSSEQHADARDAYRDRAHDSACLQDVDVNHSETKANHQRVKAGCKP